MKTLQQALEAKILVTDAKTVLEITEKWLMDLRSQVCDDDVSGVEIVMWFLRVKSNRLKGSQK